jgi:hypothetical protein
MDFELAIKLLFIQNTFVVLKLNFLKKQSNLSMVSFKKTIKLVNGKF